LDSVASLQKRPIAVSKETYYSVRIGVASLSFTHYNIHKLCKKIPSRAHGCSMEAKAKAKAGCAFRSLATASGDAQMDYYFAGVQTWHKTFDQNLYTRTLLGNIQQDAHSAAGNGVSRDHVKGHTDSVLLIRTHACTRRAIPGLRWRGNGLARVQERVCAPADQACAGALDL
jgi:hypothetical protein